MNIFRVEEIAVISLDVVRVTAWRVTISNEIRSRRCQCMGDLYWKNVYGIMCLPVYSLVSLSTDPMMLAW